MVVRGRGPRETKVCGCGCGQVFERPKGIGAEEWGRRRFVDVEHRKRAPGESRKGKRTEPKPRPSRDRKRKKDPAPMTDEERADYLAEPPEPEPEPRKVFDGPPPAEPFRPGRIPVVEPVRRTAPRPSFGLTRRSA